MAYYVGLKGGKSEVFKAARKPTEASHGHRFNAVVGPFRTKRGAELMATAGRNNPHIRSVSDAERLAKKMDSRSHGEVHPLFPRVVVYLYRDGGAFHIVVKVKRDYSSSWTTVVSDTESTASKARGAAHLLGTAWVKRVGAPGKYELEHGMPARRGPR